MGIVLDTSVLIAAEKGQLRLLDFFVANSKESFFITAITAAELLHGVERAAPVRIASRNFLTGCLRSDRTKVVRLLGQ